MYQNFFYRVIWVRASLIVLSFNMSLISPKAISNFTSYASNLDPSIHIFVSGEWNLFYNYFTSVSPLRLGNSWIASMSRTIQYASTIASIKHVHIFHVTVCVCVCVSFSSKTYGWHLLFRAWLKKMMIVFFL